MADPLASDMRILEEKGVRCMNKNLIWIGGTITGIALGAGIAYAGSDNGAVVMGVPVFALCCVVAFAVQWTLFVPAYAFQTEKYYDLAGSLTYITVALSTCIALGFENDRRILIAGLVVIWAARLGGFLFLRIRKAGEDRRFRSIKTDFLQFFMTWTLQGLWVSVTLAAGLAAMTADLNLPLGLFAIIGTLMWVFGFTIEVIADTQKSAFKAKPENSGRFINTGLWAWSRHPNYFGEILLWLGIAMIAFPVLSGWQYATLISPIFVIVLLIKVSGVRMLEHRGHKLWGNEPEYQDYMAKTSMLVPLPPK